MSSRKPHRKSRMGCLSCKRRHIKCGEEHPMCQNCIEFELQCQYPLKPTSSKEITGAGHLCSCRLNSGSERQQGQRGRSISTDREQSIIGPSNSDAEVNVSDLELLHQFTTSTYLTMSNVPQEQKVWQTTLVSLGLQHKFLLRGILSLSALHLGHQTSPPASIDYMVKATTHQNIGLAEFRKALENIDASSFDAILAFSCILPIQSLTMAASSAFYQTNPEQDVLSACIHAVSLFRSVNHLLLPSLDIYTSSTITPLLQFTTQQLPKPSIFPGIESFELLESACLSFSLATSHSSAENQRDTFRSAIGLLRSTFATTVDINTTDRFTIGAVLIWTITVSEMYYQQLNRRHPSALAIFAHFAVLLHRHNDVWWLQGLGKALIERISVVLGRDWENIMAWPKIAAGLS